MKKLILALLIVFCFTLPGWGATYYFTQAGAGDGSAPGTPDSAADFNADAFSLQPNDIVYCMGTITTTITMPASGTSGNLIVFRGDYSGSPCTIDGEDTRDTGIQTNNKDYIKITGLTVTQNNNSNVLVNTGSEGIEIDNVNANNSVDGIGIYVISTGADVVDAVVKNSSASYNGLHGIQLSGNINGAVVEKNIAFENGQKDGGHGITIYVKRRDVSEDPATWADQGGDVWSVTVTGTTLYRVCDLTDFLDLTQGSDITPDLNEWYHTGTTLYINIGKDPNTHDIIYTDRRTDDITVRYNESYDNRASGGGSEGHGIACDDFSSNVSVYGNYSHDNEGHGLTMHFSHDIDSYTNISSSNGGYGMRLLSNIDSINLYNNDIYGNGDNSISLSKPVASTNIKNNIMQDGGDYGIQASAAGISVTCDNNIILGHGVAATQNVTCTSTTTSDPLFTDTANDNFSLQPNSPAIGAGIYIPGVDRDYAGKFITSYDQINIGAYHGVTRTGGTMVRSKIISGNW